MLRLFAGRERKVGLLAEAARRAELGHLFEPSEQRVRPKQKKRLCDLARDIFGNPFRPVAINPAWLAWNDRTVPKLAQAIYDERAFECMPVLADALEESGCDNKELLSHCRQQRAIHVRGCFVLDLLLGKE
jgi:hypothetical protein